MKHAYLIMAHNDIALLNQLLSTLDDPRNDIFLHIDKKSRMDLAALYSPRYSTLSLTPRINVVWGGDSMIRCELLLLEHATKSGKYAYYHLLSGVDLPIKSQSKIHAFFNENSNNYISCEPDRIEEFISERLQLYRFFQNKIGRNSCASANFFRRLESFSLRLQRSLGVNRLKKCPLTIYKGANWFSITHEMAQIILDSSSKIMQIFSHSICADELFLQTIAMNSTLKHTVVNDSLRCIDWKRGAPYTFRFEDEELLQNSPKLFARKFNTDVDPEIISVIVSKVRKP